MVVGLNSQLKISKEYECMYIFFWLACVVVVIVVVVVDFRFNLMR